ARRPFTDPVRVHPIVLGQEPASAIEGVCQDFNPRGLGLVLSRAPGTEYVYLVLPKTATLSGLAIPARIAWGQTLSDGWLSLGVSFLLKGEAARRHTVPAVVLPAKDLEHLSAGDPRPTRARG